MSPPPATTTAGTTTRRTVLAGLGTLAGGVLGTESVGARRATGGTGTGRSTSPTTETGTLESLVDDLLTEHVDDVTPGASIAIVEGNTTRLARGYGTANVAADTPVRADETTFRVGSVGKLLTWTAVMQGVEDGKLALDEDISTYLADSAVDIPDTYAEPVTLGHLGTHTAGFESTIAPGVVSDSDALVPLETILAEQRPARVRPPGAAVGYSNYGAALAGHVVAEVYDTSFEEYVRSELFDPLGMAHSTFAQPVPSAHPGTLAAGHTRDGTAFTVPERLFINMRPAGSLSATATDMAAFMSAHLGQGSVGDARILDAETARRMHSVHHVRHPAVNNWRYGFYEYGPPGVNLIAHSGATIYFESLLVLAPEHDLGVFLNYNSDAATTARLERVVNRILDHYGVSPDSTRPEQTADPGTRERVDAVTGEYSTTRLPESGPLQLADVLARVSVEASTDERLAAGSSEWIETEPYVFHEVGGRDVLAFEMENGEVDRMHMSSAPEGVYEPVPERERQLVTGGVIGGSLAGFVLSLLGWGGRSAARRVIGRPKTATSETEDSP